MHRILIAESSAAGRSALRDRLSGIFEVAVCSDGQSALELCNCFDPDLLVLDMQIHGSNGLYILDALRLAGSRIPVLALTNIVNAYIAGRLESLGVNDVFLRPYSPDAVVHSICQIINNDDWQTQSPDNQLQSMLLQLGFALGNMRTQITYTAIMLKANGEDGTLTKHLYPAVARCCGATAEQVEKSIRDTIRRAWRQGNRAVWDMYFPRGDRSKPPTNDVFLSRLCVALNERQRIKMPNDITALEKLG